MGIYLQNAVINGLKGVFFKETGEAKKCKFGPPEMIFLATLANRQPDPGYNGHADTIAYGAASNLIAHTHIPKSSFFKVRNNLMALDLISFTPENDPSGFTNVYRLKVDTIRGIQPKDVTDQKWKNDIIRLTEKDAQKMSPNVLRALAIVLPAANNPVSTENPTVSTRDSAVSTGDSTVSTGDTNNVKNISQKSNNNNTPSPSAAVAVDAKNENVGHAGDLSEEALNTLTQHIREAVNPDNPQSVVVGRPTLIKVTRGKFINTLISCIDNTKISSKVTNPVGFLLTALKGVPTMENDPDYKKYKEQEWLTATKTKWHISQDSDVSYEHLRKVCGISNAILKMLKIDRFETVQKQGKCPQELTAYHRAFFWRTVHDRVCQIPDSLRSKYFDDGSVNTLERWASRFMCAFAEKVGVSYVRNDQGYDIPKWDDFVAKEPDALKRYQMFLDFLNDYPREPLN